MSLPPPREGSRDTGEGLLVSKYPDVCRSPKCPVPYTITAKQSDDANTCTTVRLTSLRAHNHGSIITCCSGDEPGVGLGICSNTVGSVCHRKEHSKTVRFEGKWATRHGDEWWMNNKNTIGKLLYPKSLVNYDPTPPLKEYQVAQAQSAIMSDAAYSGSASASAAMPQTGGASPAPAPSSPPPKPPGTVIYPDIEQWKKKAPKPAPPSRWWKVLKWGKRATGAGILFEGIFVPSNGYVINDRPPRDATEAALVQEGQRMLDQGQPRTDVYRWLDNSLEEHRASKPKPKEIVDTPPTPRQRTRENVSTRRRRRRCRSETICFDKRESSDPRVPKKFDEQLALQESALNAKSPAQVVASIPPPGGAEALRPLALPAQRQARAAYVRANRTGFVSQYGEAAWTAHLAQLNAVHRLDMVAGGVPTDIVGMGDGTANQHIGRQWPADSRRGKLLRYVEEMRKNNCPMNVKLRVCSSTPTS